MLLLCAVSRHGNGEDGDDGDDVMTGSAGYSVSLAECDDVTDGDNGANRQVPASAADSFVSHD